MLFKGGNDTVKKWWKLIAVAALVLAVVGAVSCAQPVSPEEMKTLKVGGTTILSGPGAAWGVVIQRGDETAAKLIEEAGGIKVGGETYKIEFIWEDCEYAAEPALAAAEKLAYRDKIKYDVGMVTLASAKAMAPVFAENNILWLLGGGANLEVIGPDHPTFYFAKPPEFAIVLAGMIYFEREYPELTKMAILSKDDPTGDAVLAEVQDHLKWFDYEIVAMEKYEPGTTDFYPVITPLLANNPDIINCTTMRPEEVTLIVKQLRERGFTGPIFESSPPPDSTVAEITGEAAEAAEGFYTTTYWTGRGLGAIEGIPEFKAKAEELYGPDGFNPIGLLLSIHVNILAQAIEEADSLDPVEIANVMDKMTFDTPIGKCKFVGKSKLGVDRVIVPPTPINKFENGQWEVVGIVEADEIIEVMWK